MDGTLKIGKTVLCVKGDILMNLGLKIALVYMLIISIIGFLLMGIDKSKAKRNAWRIPEKKLFMIAFLGGGAGVWLGMRVFHHKTLHLMFKYGVPAITLLEFIGVCYVFIP